MKKLVFYVLLVFILCSLVMVWPAAAAVNGKIAFSSTRDSINGDIYMMNADGSGLTRFNNLLSLPFRVEPGLSPDGTKIAFVSTGPSDTNDWDLYDIYVMNVDGTGVTRLTHRSDPNFPNKNRCPAWSPDGKKIAFISDREDSYRDLYVMNAKDGSGLTRLTTKIGLTNDRPAWSPDGREIAFTWPHDDNTDIYVINKDGKGLKRMTKNPAADSEPAWSPDGTKIAFSSNRNGRFEIYIINVKTGIETRLEKYPLPRNIQSNMQPAWSPDGTKIAFTSERNRNIDIYMINLNTHNEMRLTNDPAKDETPTWGSKPTIAVTSPNGGETWQAGTTHRITWSQTGLAGTNVKLNLYWYKNSILPGSYQSTIVSSVPAAQGYYCWTIPTNQPVNGFSSFYRVDVRTLTAPWVVDMSDGGFKITSPSAITVTSPNGGENWDRSNHHLIAWDYTGNPEEGATVRILLYYYPSFPDTPPQVELIGDNVKIGSGGKGSFNWFIPLWLSTGSRYKIQISSKNAKQDNSNDYFAITSGSAPT